MPAIVQQTPNAQVVRQVPPAQQPQRPQQSQPLPTPTAPNAPSSTRSFIMPG